MVFLGREQEMHFRAGSEPVPWPGWAETFQPGYDFLKAGKRRRGIGMRSSALRIVGGVGLVLLGVVIAGLGIALSGFAGKAVSPQGYVILAAGLALSGLMVTAGIVVLLSVFKE